MKEHEVIAYTVAYLIKEKKYTVNKISTPKPKKKYVRLIKGILSNKRVSKRDIDAIQFKTTGADIVYKWEGQRQIEVEAKGGDDKKSNKIHTALGQFICLKESRSDYHWFAFAFPYSWRKQIRKMFLCASDGNIKPIISDIIENYQGLHFYFVKDNGKILREPWRKIKKEKVKKNA